jgi:hypothetical protein
MPDKLIANDAIDNIVEILTRSIIAPIEIDTNDISSVLQTMEEYRITAQYASDYGFFSKTANSPPSLSVLREIKLLKFLKV